MGQISVEITASPGSLLSGNQESGIKFHFIDAKDHHGGSEWDQDEHDTHHPKKKYSGSIDIFENFRAWKAAGQNRKDGSEQQTRKIIDVVSELRSRGGTFPQVAAQMNFEEIYSTTGKRWTAEGPRKFLENKTGK